MSNAQQKFLKRYARNNGKSQLMHDGQFVPLSYRFLHSPAWRSLRGPAVKVWLELRSRYNGGNNGKLALSCDSAAKVLHLGKATVLRAFKELQDKGFIVMTRRGQWYGRMATTWAVTDKPCDGNLATRTWETWQPQTATKQRAKKRDLGFRVDPELLATIPPQN